MNTNNANTFAHMERVRWVDTDASQGIHSTAMFRYFEAAEQEFLRSLGFTPSSLHKLGVDLPRVHAECSYKAFIAHDEILEITVTPERIGNTSVTLIYQAKRTSDDITAASGSVTFCTVRVQTGQPTALPEELRQALQSVRKDAKS